MRNTKLIVAMVAGCMAMTGAAIAQDSTAPQATKGGSATQSSSDAMKNTSQGTNATPTSNKDNSQMNDSSSGSMSKDSMSKDSMSGGSMKSTHKKSHPMKKTSDGTETMPAKSSSSGM